MAGRESRWIWLLLSTTKGVSSVLWGSYMGGRTVTPSAVSAEPHPVAPALPDIMPHALMFLKNAALPKWVEARTHTHTHT